ncbi:butyrophilin subfamily 1 member A1-like isoform X2 [Trematomus bernacchii]|uniref:butyrophilin subfamily 1 member A1-like isoform X2 n=1 Tax=Trematomus bernacchii TaxID=40690 RepID=UPI00146DC88F|nr:butyrophilin subfamily 1 member A1-like isoform X2 [Trematomus bernacchii]
MVHLVPGSTMPLLALAVFLVPWTDWSEGRPQLIGSSQPIRAPLGSDVLLPCILQPERNIEGILVRWWRPNVPPDPQDPKSDYWYIHLYPENQHQEDLTMPSYVGRTEMFADGLKLGNVSLRIRNLQLSDDGRYRCFIPMLWIDTDIMLEVFDPISDDTLTTTQFQGNLQTPDPKNETDVKVGRHYWSLCFVVLAFCILLAVGRFLKHKCQRRDLPCCLSETNSPPSSSAEYVVIRASDVGF